MILNNSQANIFKVNGGIADNFANRPTANGSFYIFYSLDTQEIFYDSGTWVLIGTGNLPTPTNIYNSDGTLTGNRTLNGENNFLRYENLSFFETIYSGFSVGLSFDFVNDIYNFGDTNNKNGGTGIQIFSQLNINDRISLFANTSGIDTTIFDIDATNKYIKTSYQGNDIGLKLDFANNFYSLGSDPTIYGIGGFWVDTNLCNNYVGDGSNNYEGVNLQVNNNPKIIKTQYQLNDIGLKLDFANQDYIFGDINKAFINIQNFSNIKAIGLISSATTYITQEPGSPTTIRNDVISLAAFSGVDNVILNIDAQSRFSGFSYQNQSQGIGLAFQNKIYSIGQLTGGNTTKLTIEDGATYPIQFDGTNVLSTTSGGTSGQHLKVKINGTNYKIKLENP